MGQQLIGRFYFKRTRYGNLIGEFSNNIGNMVSTESADPINFTADYTGVYRTTWQEEGIPHFADLEITHRIGTNNRIFSLIWRVNNTTIFTGEGMLCDDILIGDYRSS